MDATVLKSPATVDLTGLVHYMPCDISHNGPALVGDYFVPSIRKCESTAQKPDSCISTGSSTSTNSPNSEHFTASFRGRPLNGTECLLTPSYTGLVLEESSGKTTAANTKPETQWTPIGAFQTLTYWNWDKIPSNDDDIPRLMQWARISDAAQKSARALMPDVDNLPDSDTES